MSKLYECLMAYGNEKVSPFHMPGHKRKTGKFHFADPFSIDITEIDGFDNLHHPTGILKEAMEAAASVYGAEKSYFLINGSSGGLLAAISACVPGGGTLLVARNCHKSVYHGMALRKIRPVYLCPEPIPGWGISGEIKPEAVEEALLKNPAIQAVLFTSPTYEGVCSDVKRISEIAHKRGIPVIVDAAHGAHFSFWEICEPAVSCGADLVIESLHKTLPSLTQTAILHKNSGLVDERSLEWYLQVYQTSSPSYVLMASIDSCISYMAGGQGKKDMAAYVSLLRTFREKAAGLSGIRLLSEKEAGGAYDISKLVIRANGWSGRELYERLRQDYSVQPEMCTESYVILMTSVADDSAVFHRLFEALVDIHRKCGKVCGKLAENPKNCGFLSEEEGSEISLLPKPQVVLTLSAAIEGKKTKCPLADCAGKISGEFAYIYPPGIPLLAPGERILAQVLEILERYEKNGLEVLGPEDFSGGRLWVVAEEEADGGQDFLYDGKERFR